MQFIVYDKTGENIRCTTRKLEYSGTFMGECSVTMDITSPTPIDFHIGDYVEYRGERFEINYDPSVIKTARRETVGDAFKYENIKFNSLSDELVRADFLDYVSNDNNIHFTALPSFSFFCSDVRDLAQRIQANLDRVYTGSKKWTVSVHSEFVGKKDVSISVSNIKVWDALALASSDFDANFIIRGRTITIGTAGIAVGNMFSYGKNNGLFEIERSAEPDQAIITRLRAYGSEKNLPPRYYNKLSNLVPNNMAVTHLMLPNFPLTSLDPYIDSENIAQLGIREGSVFFDGSNGNEEIYPSIEGMTYQGTNIDEVQSAEQTTDDGIWEVPEGETSVNIPNFTITLYDLGFDICDYLIEGQNPVISMKSGLCAGREFEIVNVSQDIQTGYYTLECRRVEDSSLGLVFPYKDYNVKSGDKFVLLYISMPTQYITAAAQRLYDAAVAYLAKNDYVRYSYSPKVDNIFLQRQHDTAIANSDISIHDTIKEGDLLLFNDTDLGISGSIIIDQLTIKEGDELIPQYEITLRNDKTVGTIQRLQQQIDSIVSGATAVGGYNSQQIQSIMRAFGDVRYLRKDIDDVAKGLIDSLKGFQVGADFVSGLLGEGGIFRKEADGKTYIEADRLYVRMKAYFDEIEVKKYTHSGGNRIASKTGVKTVKVEYYNANDEIVEDASQAAYYRCYFRLSDDDGNTITNDWVVGDLARSQEFKGGTNGYWRAVVGVGATPDADGLGYIDLSKSDCLQDSDVPQAQDDIIQLGNKTVTDRQGAIIEYSTGANAPSYQIYQGINDYNLNGKNYVTLGYNSSTGKAELIVYGDAFIGDQNGSHIQYNSTTGNLTIKATIDAQSTVGNMTLGQQFDYLQRQIDGVVDKWYVDENPTLSNYPASEWTTDEKKYMHLGDLAYNKNTGHAYRFVNNGTDESPIYAWSLIPDSDIASVLKEFADLQYLTAALGQNTTIDGGLILTSLIQLRDTNGNVKSGISGLYDTSLVDPGKSIAAWYGGLKTDWETLSDAQKQSATDGSYAKSLFRMDGTGYVASGNISWDANGRVTLKNLYTDTGKNIDQLLALFSIGGTIPTNAYITPAYPFSDLQVLTNSGNAVSVKDYLSLFIPHYNATTGELESIESPVPLWSQGEVSALGYDDSGGGGGGGGTDLTAVWTTLTGNTGTYKDYQIHSGHLTSALANYALSSSLATVATSGSYNDLTDKPTIPAAQIQSDWNQTTTTAKDYIKNKPTIPAAQVQSNWNATSGMGVILNKPTKVSAFTNDANYVTSSSLTTTLASYATQTWVTNKGYATTSAMNTELAKYLPLTGGTMSNTNLVTNLNADLLDGVHASGLFTALANNGNNISLTIGGTNKTLTVGYASKSKKAGDSWTSVVTIGEWSKVLEISGYTAVLLSVNLISYAQSANATFLINNAWSCARIVQIGTGGYTVNSNFDIRITRSENTTIDVEIKTSYSYQSATTQDVVCHAVNIHNSGTLTPYTSYTAGSGTLVDSFTSYSRYSFIGNSLRLNGGSTSTTSPDLYIAGTSWFGGAIKVGNAYIWWDDTNSCLRITGANSSGTPVASVAANVNVSGEVSALGANTSGGGGGGDGASLAAVWTSLGSSTGTYGSSQINASHLTNALASYATQSWVNQQGFLKSYTETDPVFVASPAHGITASNISAWNNKQDAISDLATIRSNASAGAAKVSNVQADWTATSGLAVILHKPTLATVATSGKYSDLTGAPTKVSDFTNDANYITSSSLATTLASYATTSAMNTALSGYLPLTGGTLSGNLSVERTGTTDSSKVTVTNVNGSVSLLTSTPNRGIYDDDNSKWLIGTNGANTFLLDGYVGINTTAPSYQLHVNGNTYASRYYVGSSNYLAGGSTWLYFIVDSATPLIAGSTYVRRGTSDSDVTLGTSSYRWANLYSVLGNFSGLITASGNIKTESYIEIGDYRIVADTANNALKVVHKNGTTAVNFYATGEVSALKTS